MTLYGFISHHSPNYTA